VAVPVSSLSVAVQGIADYLDSQFDEDVVISVNSPQRASELIKGTNSDAHCLNIFVYRIAPSGFHASAGVEEPQFIRIYALLTPFPAEGETVAADADLRILGEAIRVLQFNPVLPIATSPPLPGAPVADPDQPDFRRGPHLEYRLQAVMQAPPMEELNHIWTTQGGELAYRLSAAYEFALIPVEPLVRRSAPAPVRSALYDVAANLDGRDQAFLDISAGTQAIPLAGTAPQVPPPTSWLPVQMLVDGDVLTNARVIADTATDVEVALAGPVGEEVALEVVWTLADASEQSQSAQVVTLQTPLIDHPDARHTLSLSLPATATGAVILTRAAAGGAPLPESPFTNTLSLTVS
jgi:hypothetical protein